MTKNTEAKMVSNALSRMDEDAQALIGFFIKSEMNHLRSFLAMALVIAITERLFSVPTDVFQTVLEDARKTVSSVEPVAIGLPPDGDPC